MPPPLSAPMTFILVVVPIQRHSRCKALRKTEPGVLMAAASAAGIGLGGGAVSWPIRRVVFLLFMGRKVYRGIIAAKCWSIRALLVLLVFAGRGSRVNNLQLVF